MSATTLLPLLSAIFVLYLGVFVLIRNIKSRLSILFTLLCLSMIVWFFGTFMMFMSEDLVQAEFWDRFVYIGVIFIPILMYNFSLIFAQIKGRKILYLGYFLSFVFLILSRTDYFVSDVYQYSWGYHTQARIAHHAFLVFFSAYLALFYFNIYRYSKITKISIERIQAKYIFLAFLVLLTGSIAYLPAYGIDVYPTSYLSGLFFAIILAYTVVKHHLMNVKMILTEFLVGLIGLILLTEVIISKDILEFLFRTVIFLLFSFFGFLLIKSALNEIKRREQLERLTIELKKTSEKLRKADKIKSEFVSIASHQLRTPLTAIKGYISMIVGGTYGEISARLTKPLGNVYESNEKLIRLVNDLLDLSRLDSGKIKFEPAPVLLEKMVSHIIEEMKINADKKGLYVKLVEPQKSLPKIMADQAKLRQVILNIIDNAIKYTAKGGITVKLEKIDSRIQISIADSGEGITKEEAEDLFKIFSRSSAGTRLHTEGAGVGLYVAKKFIDMHNGKIWVESEGEGKGSTFYIELPCKES